MNPEILKKSEGMEYVPFSYPGSDFTLMYGSGYGFELIAAIGEVVDQEDRSSQPPVPTQRAQLRQWAPSHMGTLTPGISKIV